MTAITSQLSRPDQVSLAAGIVAVESTSHMLHVRDHQGHVYGPLPQRVGDPPPWEVTAALLAIDEAACPLVLVIAGSPIAAGSTAHFGWLRALTPHRLFVCRRSVHMLWRHPADVDATAAQRLDAYAEIAATVVAETQSEKRLRQIVVREVIELDTDLTAVLDTGASR